MDTVNFRSGPSSGYLDGQLFQTGMIGAIMPPAAPYIMQSQGSGPSGLPGVNPGGASTSRLQSAAGGAMDAANPTTGSGSVILGLPGFVWALFAILALGYVFIWKVHFE